MRVHRTAAAIIEAKRFNYTQALVLVHHFADGSHKNSHNYRDFSDFAKAIRAPIPETGRISEAVELSGVSLRFAWVDDNCKPPQGVGVRDLIAALGESNQLAGVKNELARYWRQRLKILSELFDLPPDWAEDTAHTPRMIADLAQASCRGCFFEQFLEYTSLRGEEEIRSHHKSHIETQEALLRERLLDLAEDFLLHFWRGLKGKHFREEELVSKGLPSSEPDRLDFI